MVMSQCHARDRAIVWRVVMRRVRRAGGKRGVIGRRRGYVGSSCRLSCKRWFLVSGTLGSVAVLDGPWMVNVTWFGINVHLIGAWQISWQFAIVSVCPLLVLSLRYWPVSLPLSTRLDLYPFIRLVLSTSVRDNCNFAAYGMVTRMLSISIGQSPVVISHSTACLFHLSVCPTLLCYPVYPGGDAYTFLITSVSRSLWSWAQEFADHSPQSSNWGCPCVPHDPVLLDVDWKNTLSRVRCCGLAVPSTLHDTQT